MRWIQRRDGAEGPRYREWSTIVDQYITPPITRAQMRKKLIDEGASAPDVDVRLARVDERGTSRLFGDGEVIGGPWDTERCDGCGDFHHTFELRESDKLCCSCGQDEVSTCHKPPCKVKRQ